MTTHAPTVTRRALRARRARTPRLALAIGATIAVVALGLPAQSAMAAPSTVTSDDFQRTVSSGWGAIPTGGSYTGSAPSGSMSVSSGSAQLSLAAGQSSSVIAGPEISGDTRSDVAVRIDQLAGSSYYAFILRYQNDNSQYRGRLQVNSAGVPTLAISRVNGKQEVSLGSKKLDGALTGAGWYTLSFSVTGQSPVTIEGSLTKQGSTAGAPQLSVTDATASRITASGRTGWWAYVSSSATKSSVLRLDDLKVTGGASPLSSAPTTPAPAPTTPTPTPTTPAPAPTTPSPAPATGDAPGGNGSVAVGSANYAVPAGAIFVNANAASNGSGTVSSPYKSVQSAVDAAKAGSTIVLRKGTYHQEVTIPYGKGLTVQAYPKEAVWFDGSSVVSNWVKSGTRWVSNGWTKEFKYDMGGQNSRFVSPSYPVADRPDQLFIDGKNLTQVATAAEVVAGTFAVDYAKDQIILGSDPTGHEVRSSDLQQAFNVIAADSTLQGFGVRRYGTVYGSGGAIRMQNVGATLRNLIVTDNAMLGLTLANNNSVGDSLTVQRNGMLGIGVNAAYNSALKNSVITDNNVEHFKDAPVAGGVKITRSRGITVSGNTVSDNTGAGIWFDESCYNITVSRNLVTGNSTTGTQLEISDTATVSGNRFSDNGTGLMAFDSGNIKIFNNEFSANTFNGVSLKQDSRRQATQTVGRDPRVGGVDATVPWITQNIVVSNNAFGSVGQFAIFARDQATNRAVDTWNLTINGNLFNNQPAGGPGTVAWGKGDNVSVEKYQTPAALAAAKNPSWKNAMTTTVLPFGQMDAEIAKAAATAVALPSAVASTLNQPVGAKFVGAYPRE